MRNHRIVVMIVPLLVGSCVARPMGHGQQAPAGTDERQVQTSQGQAKQAPEVPANAAVLTIDGLCETADPKATQTGATCKTVLTRAEFESYTNAINPAMSAEAKRQFAESYARFLTFAGAARKEGLDKTPRFQKQLELTQLQMLAQAFLQELQEKSRNISDEERQKFYRENPNRFLIADLQRIYVPSAAADEQNALPDGQKVDMKAVADQLRTRAAAGEEFTRLQKEAFRLAHMESPPSVNLEKMPRSRLEADQRVVLDMKPGDVSPVIPSTGAYFIYKLISKDIAPIESVKEQIDRDIQSQRMDAWMKSTVGSTKVSLNQEYFPAKPAEKK